MRAVKATIDRQKAKMAVYQRALDDTKAESIKYVMEDLGINYDPTCQPFLWKPKGSFGALLCWRNIVTRYAEQLVIDENDMSELIGIGFPCI